MSPPESTGDEDSSSREQSSQSDDLATYPRQEVVVDSLGEALAGVNLGPQTSSFGHSSLAAALSHGASSATNENDGWGNFAETTAPSSSLFSGSSMASAQGAKHANNESLQLFLSQDPSHTLGEDVFNLSNQNLPAANYEESKSDSSNAFRFPGQSRAPGPSNFGEIRPAPEQRRRTDSPSGTGTTASSRSVSPYASSDNAQNGGGRTIQAYQGYEAASGETMGRNHSSFNEDDRSSSGYNSLAHGHGSHPSLVTLDSRSPYGKDRNFGAGGSYEQHGFDRQLGQQDPGQQQPQVLYMAVPSPDGRGQVLQPVQMIQLPGKPYTYVVPGGSNGGALQTPGFFPAGDGSQGSLMNLPPLANGTNDYSGLNTDLRAPVLDNLNRNNYGVDNSRASYGSDAATIPARDDYSTRGANGVPFQTDPALSAAYASPQRPPLDSLLGQVRRLSRDQVGCRLVQQALDEEGPMAATLILQEGLPFWGEAMVDPFGNYLFQKILEKVTTEERVMLVKSVSTRLVNASLNLHGTRSVQKVVELCAQDEQSNETPGSEETAATILTKALAPAAARLCIDSHGNHVIQRILLKLGPDHSKFVFDAVAASVEDVARHRHGCCVIQRCLDSPPNEARSHLVKRIVEKSLELMQDAYGNYVVQYVLDVCSDEDVHAVCESVVGKVNLLAIQKFSSNVMEKCLERCSDRVKELYMQEMSDPDRIRELMMDPFGNYVVQRALSVATHAQAIHLVEAMRPHLIATQTGNGQRNGGVRNTAGGRRIIAKICRRFPNFTLNPALSKEELYSQNKGNRHHSHNLLHHHQPPVIQSYATVGGPTPTHHYLSDPRLSQGHIPMQQQQQQSFYSIGGNAGYYDQFSSGHGSYPGM